MDSICRKSNRRINDSSVVSVLTSDVTSLVETFLEINSTVPDLARREALRVLDELRAKLTTPEEKILRHSFEVIGW